MKKGLRIALWVTASLVGLVAFCAIVVVGLVFCMFGSLHRAPEPGESSMSWRSYLPATATDVKEHAWADGFLPDYDYYLRARISKAEFEKFVQDLGLTPHTSTRVYSEESWLSWSGHLIGNKEWWHPTDSLEGTYVKEGGTTWSFAKYEDEFLYFRSLDH